VQVLAESRVGEVEDQLRRARTQLDEQTRQLQDVGLVNARLTQENQELHRQLLDLDTGNASLAKTRTDLQQQLQETKMKLDDETRVTFSRPYLCNGRAIGTVVVRPSVRPSVRL